ncbi:MAG: methyl-accepting chemotaxis protein [Acidobacteria bacterium]|nr:methyl-accepting chemotaxis protein [Acidobacteriota bacterium]
MAKQPDRRKRVLIDELQYRMLRVNLAYFFVILLVFLVSLFGPLVVQLLNADGSFFARERVAQQFLLLDDTIWLPLILTFSCLGLHSILVSHRIAGPLHQLRQLLGGIGDGDLVTRAVLRKRDYLQKEEAAMNNMIDKLASKINRIEEQAADLQMRLGSLRTAITTGASAEALDQLGALYEHAESLNSTVRQFKIRPDVTSMGPVAVSTGLTAVSTSTH